MAWLSTGAGPGRLDGPREEKKFLNSIHRQAQKEWSEVEGAAGWKRTCEEEEEEERDQRKEGKDPLSLRALSFGLAGFSGLTLTYIDPASRRLYCLYCSGCKQAGGLFVSVWRATRIRPTPARSRKKIHSREGSRKDGFDHIAFQPPAPDRVRFLDARTATLTYVCARTNCQLVPPFWRLRGRLPNCE